MIDPNSEEWKRGDHHGRLAFGVLRIVFMVAVIVYVVRSFL